MRPASRDGANATIEPVDDGFEFGLLGPLIVTYRGRSVPIRSPKHRALLAALLVDANRVVSVGTLVRRLWDDRPPSGARVTLQNHVMGLRRVLASVTTTEVVRTARDGYRIVVDPDHLDLHRFDRLLNRANLALAGGDPARGAALLGEALALWRGDALVDVRSEVLRREVVPALAGRRLRAFELRFEALGR